MLKDHRNIESYRKEVVSKRIIAFVIRIMMWSRVEGDRVLGV